MRLVAVLGLLFFSPPVFAKLDARDALLIKPPADGGRYLNMYQSKNLYQWGYNFGFMADYAFEPVKEISGSTGLRVRGVIDDLYTGNIYGALGLTDWFSVGVNMPLGYETFFDPNSAQVVPPKEKKFVLGDPRLDLKFRFLDIDRYNVGLGAVVFGEFPVGNSRMFFANGRVVGGGKFILDFAIADHVFITLNAGAEYMRAQIFNNRTQARVGSLLMGGAGIDWAITDTWALMAEAYTETLMQRPFQFENERPGEALGGVRFTPQTFAKGLGITLGGGAGLPRMHGFGSPDWRALAQINFRRSDVVTLPPPPPPVELEASYEEKIVITQTIHFEFNKAAIRPVSYPILNDVIAVLQRNPLIKKVRIEGHTDSVGSDTYNQKLSQKRADSVRNYLIEHDISPSRLEAIGYGESRPIADNESVEGRARNRRTDFTVTDSAE